RLDCLEQLGLEMMFVFWQGTHNSLLRTSPSKAVHEDGPCGERHTYLHGDRKMTENTSDDMPYKEVNRAAKILMQIANVVNQHQPNKDTNNEEIRACFRREEALGIENLKRLSHIQLSMVINLLLLLKRRSGKPLKGFIITIFLRQIDRLHFLFTV
ncbi:hypothetical protein H5410_053565, partial [Solanum commersonii]